MNSANFGRLIGLVYLISAVFFVLGLTNPIMGRDILLGLERSDIYLLDSVRYFFEEGEWFLGIMLCLFTFIVPIFKYVTVGVVLIGLKEKISKTLMNGLEFINKWAMLDVFIVALVVMNMKFETAIIDTFLMRGTTYFAVSVLLLMFCSKFLVHRDRKLTA